MAVALTPATVLAGTESPFRRRISLAGIWSLRLDPDAVGAGSGWERGSAPFETPIPVPGCVNALESLADRYPSHTMANAYEGGCWYRRSFTLPRDWSAPRTFLKFGGVMPAANVWLNETHLGYHAYSPIAFAFDATDALRHDGENVLTVELPWRDVDLRGGMKFGSGLWRSVELEASAAVRIEDLFIDPDPASRRVHLTAQLINDDNLEHVLELVARSTPWRGAQQEISAPIQTLRVPARGQTRVEFTLDMPGGRLWSPEDPFLYVLTLSALQAGIVIDAVTERFGLRRMVVDRDCLRLNDQPLMLRGVCDEFQGSPTIAPITDPVLLRRRLEMLRDLGFNAKRFHTHIPPREEIELCDELGILVQAEISVISNFNRTEPYPASRDVWRAGLRQLRNHASLVIYCMGNEGSQCMDGLYDRVREYYADAKELSPHTPVLAACGMQGEHPQVPNDFETPHFWARFYKWAYDGLSSIPWDALAPLASKGPLVIHEYAKFTIWPNPAEDVGYSSARLPLRGRYGQMGRIALEEAGMVELLDRVIHNSRALAATCHKIAIEEARRHPAVTGYQVLSAFRLNCNRGMADELALNLDSQFADYPKVNAPTALVLDRGYQGRTWLTGQTVRVTLHLSHFGTVAISQGLLRWRLLRDGEMIEQGECDAIDLPSGRNAPIATLVMRTPAETTALRLVAELEQDEKIFAANAWDFWAFSQADGHGLPAVLCDTQTRGLDLDLMAQWPSIRRLDDAVSLHRGDRITKVPTDHDVADYIRAHRPPALIGERWTPDVAGFVEAGGAALLLDTGHFPTSWYAPREPTDNAYGADIEFDLFTLFSPFRTGWDHGNAATIIEPHRVLEDFPHEGYCDLQCFAMVQGARTLRLAELPGDRQPIVRVIPMWMRHGPQAGPSPENPDIARPYATESRAYLVECRVGAGRLIISSLRHFADPAGRWLLDRLLREICAGGSRT